MKQQLYDVLAKSYTLDILKLDGETIEEFAANLKLKQEKILWLNPF